MLRSPLFDALLVIVVLIAVIAYLLGQKSRSREK
jgi:hypothetical protein